MKILLIAGFSDNEVREHLSFHKDNKLFHNLIKLFHLPARVGNYYDHASWVRSMIIYFEKQSDIELHVAGPHIRLKKSIEEFELRSVYYHFFREEFSAFTRIVNNYHVWKRIQQSGRYTKKILNKVQPDLVILSGAENPVTSISILYAKDYPRICLCQTIYGDKKIFMHPNKLKVSLERAIFSDVQNFGVYCKMHYDSLQEIVGNGKYIFKYNYPPRNKTIDTSDKEKNEKEKKYDFVNFALTHCKGKGTFDSIQALEIVKKEYPNVTLNIVGGCYDNVRKELDILIKKLGLENNVIFTPFFENRNDLFLHIQQSRFAVLPSKLDNTSGTMSQAMRFGLPLIVYKTAGTPLFNREKECALIAEMDNVEQLAKHMIELMGNPEKAESLKKNGRWYMENKVGVSRRNWDRLVAAFPIIIENFKYGTPIPKERLFNPILDD